MNHHDARAYLGIVDPNPSEEFIKRQYRIKALQFHPDKNKSPRAVEDFQNIQSAYEFLMEQKIHHDDHLPNYSSVLFSFLSNVLGEESKNELLAIILQRLSSKCEQTLITTIERLDKTTLLKLYDIIKRFWHILHLPESVFNHLETILQEKHKDDECILLNPTLTDLFENNLYRLTINEVVYIIPLWHHELVYDAKEGSDIIVKCFPMLDENIYIDEQNHIHVNLQYDILDLLNKDTVVVNVGPKPCSFFVKQLRLVQFQTLILPSCGISMIHTKQVFDVSKKSDICLHIELTNFTSVKN